MCGIAGIIATEEATSLPSLSELVRIRDHMVARGPDGFGSWASSDGRAIFGHRRLSIQDLDPRANQPLLSADGRFAIVFNGEIYNAPELRNALRSKGTIFRTASDTEVLLELYARSGESMLSELRGMYAFAIFDTQTRELFAARDPYGIKPFYYSFDKGLFRFASQVKALLAGGVVDSTIDLGGLAGFWLFGNVPEPLTFQRAVSALAPGCYLRVDRNGLHEPKVFASIAGALNAQTDGGAIDVVQHLHDGVRDSVRAHLLSDVEVGVFLSAGIDSAALLGLMNDCGKSRVTAVTLSFDEFVGTTADETPLAAEIARQYDARHVIRRVTRREFEADLPALLAAMDQPSVDGVNTWFVAKAAKEAGLKVALSGLGGDELLAGYPSFRDVPRWVSIFGMPGAVPGLGKLARVAGATMFPAFAKRNPKAFALLEYGGAYSKAYMLRRSVHLLHDLPGLMGIEQARAGLLRLEPLALIQNAMTPDPGDPQRRISALESGLYMKNQLLRDADWAGMAHSIEIRTPLVDYKLLRFLAPVLRRLSGRAGKLALASAPQIPLPSLIVDRKKTGFAVPTRAWTSAIAVGANDRTTSRRWAHRVLEANGADVPSATKVA